MNNVDIILGKKLQTPEGTAKCCSYGASYLRDMTLDKTQTISIAMLLRLSEIFKAAEGHLSPEPEETEPKVVVPEPQSTFEESLHPPWEKENG